MAALLGAMMVVMWVMFLVAMIVVIVLMAMSVILLRMMMMKVATMMLVRIHGSVVQRLSIARSSTTAGLLSMLERVERTAPSVIAVVAQGERLAKLWRT